ncbi:MAG: tail fiber domain-containing protein, partial [bacterium]|nr:tail fiber domain-containing protein [bacterium]
SDSGSVVVNAGNAETAFTLNQTGTGKIMDLQKLGVSAFTILNNGNVGIGTSTPSLGPLVMGSGAYVTTGGAWTNASDVNMKENFTAINNNDILNKIKQLSVTQWNYKNESSQIKHIGPTAQDFYGLFNLGGSNTSISTIDPAGVALVGIKALAGEFDKFESFININNSGKLIISSPQSASSTQEGQVEIVDLTKINASSAQTVFVVNQDSTGDIADFQAKGVSVVNIGQAGKVTIVGELLVDGRIMICSGGSCSSALDNAVDQTMGDMGVEGKVVAETFENYCKDGFVWTPGSAKYGTMPGFCVMSDLVAVSKSQGEAQLACNSLGNNYHLISENEWLTLAENILKVSDNDLDKNTAGIQLAIGQTEYKLTNKNIIKNLANIGEWTDQNITSAGLPVVARSNDWNEYYEVSNYQGLNIAPAYYLTSTNGIGKILTKNSNVGLRGFVRGNGGIYGLDLSHAPDEQNVNIGFRCAK